MTTKPKRDEWRRLCDAATGDLWLVTSAFDGSVHIDLDVEQAPLVTCHQGNKEAKANARFIAASRTALPACLDELDEKDERIERLEATVERLREAIKRTPFLGDDPGTQHLSDALAATPAQNVRAIEARGMERVAKIFHDNVLSSVSPPEIRRSIRAAAKAHREGSDD